MSGKLEQSRILEAVMSPPQRFPTKRCKEAEKRVAILAPGS